MPQYCLKHQLAGYWHWTPVGFRINIVPELGMVDGDIAAEIYFVRF